MKLAKVGNRMEKRIFFIVMIGLFVCCYGCSQKPSEEGRITIEFLTSGGGAWMKEFNELIDEFQVENPGIKVKLMTSTGVGHQSKILSMAVAGAPPDVFHSSLDIGYFATFVEKGIIRDLKPFIEKDEDFDLSDFFPCGIKAFTVKGGIYALPIDMNPLVLLYNKTMFDERGLSYPDNTWTKEDVLDTAKKLTRDTNGNGKPDEFGFLMFSSFDFMFFWLLRAGIPLFNEDYTRVAFNNQEAADIVQFMVDLRLKYEVSPPPALMTESGAPELFASGKVAMMETIPAFFAQLVKYKGLKFEWDIAPVCRLGKEGVTGLAISGYNISSKTRYPDEAWRLVKFLTGAWATKIMRQRMGTISPRRSVTDDPSAFGSPPENIKIIPEVLEHAESLPVFPKYREFVQTIVKPKLDLVFIGQKKVKDALDEIEREGNRLLGLE